jgi:hypothetical protein
MAMHTTQLSINSMLLPETYFELKKFVGNIFVDNFILRVPTTMAQTGVKFTMHASFFALR